MSIEGQGHFFTIYFPGFVCFVLYLAKISGERLQDHWSSGYLIRERCTIFNRQIAEVQILYQENVQAKVSQFFIAMSLMKLPNVFILCNA